MKLFNLYISHARMGAPLQVFQVANLDTHPGGFNSFLPATCDVLLLGGAS
jgi:hypothetical protein